jgi:hypothetical protein
VKEKSGGPSAQPSLAASFSTTFIRGEARWTPHPLKDRGDDDRYAVPATDFEGPVDRTNLRGRRLLFWVKSGKNSVRVYVFRCAHKLGHCLTQLALRILPAGNILGSSKIEIED